MLGGDDDHSEEIFGGAVKKRTRISTPEGWLIRRGHQKIFSETSEKPLDNYHKVWYNKDVPREGDAEMPHGYQQVPEKKSSEMEKPSEKPLTLDHESDIMNTQ